MCAKKTVKSGWKCKKCGKSTDLPGKVCVECRTGRTAIRGYVAKKAAAPKGKRGKGSRPSGAEAPRTKVKDVTLCDALSRALDIEREGRKFYLKCTEHTTSPEGKSMFTYLANEEKIHYGKVAELYEREEYKAYCEYVEAKGLSTGIFERNVKGADLDNKPDALSALNVGIKAEENSIELYSRLSNDAPSEEMRVFFERLVVEERSHRTILLNEVEFVTGTGVFKDFTTVTM